MGYPGSSVYWCLDIIVDDEIGSGNNEGVYSDVNSEVRSCDRKVSE